MTGHTTFHQMQRTLLRVKLKRNVLPLVSGRVHRWANDWSVMEVLIVGPPTAYSVHWMPAQGRWQGSTASPRRSRALKVKNLTNRGSWLHFRIKELQILWLMVHTLWRACIQLMLWQTLLRQCVWMPMPTVQRLNYCGLVKNVITTKPRFVWYCHLFVILKFKGEGAWLIGHALGNLDLVQALFKYCSIWTKVLLMCDHNSLFRKSYLLQNLSFIKPKLLHLCPYTVIFFYSVINPAFNVECALCNSLFVSIWHSLCAVIENCVSLIYI